MLDCRSKGPRFDPRLGHEGDFLRLRGIYNRNTSAKYSFMIVTPRVGGGAGRGGHSLCKSR